MVTCTEIEAITKAAEERAYQQYLHAREITKKETCEYCSTVISEQLKKRADIPTHYLEILTTNPIRDDEMHILYLTNSAYNIYDFDCKRYNIKTLVEFIEEHGFKVTIEDAKYRSGRSSYSMGKKITIRW